jgi:acetylornithine/succinyldiaminopimelate/putrescine aminotransferase
MAGVKVVPVTANIENGFALPPVLEIEQKITTKTAGIILESIQGGAGFIEPQNDFLAKVKKRCEEVG